MATLDQSKVADTLNTLMLEYVESNGFGGDMTFKVTEKTLEFLKGKSVIIGADARTTIS